jgi:hypothetical protein
MPSTTVAARVSGEHRQALEHLAAAKGVRLGDLVRDALALYLVTSEEEAA